METFMSRLLVPLTLTLLAFAGNSVLCRMALKETSIDAASFTTLRLLSGALMLVILVRLRSAPERNDLNGSWRGALALFAYAVLFSYAYLHLSTATGALLLFGAVQLTMIGYGLLQGERLQLRGTLGALLAFGGMVWLLLPGLTAPPLASAVLMLGAGVAWGIYSLLGRGARSPLQMTAGNFLRTVPMTLALSLLTLTFANLDAQGVWLAVASGAITSGLGYAIWYRVLPQLQATQAATVQLSVPVIAAGGGILLLQEPLTLRLILAGITVLGGIALVIKRRPQ
jgi:drug/metabolite transporter (DMT)-like permease